MKASYEEDPNAKQATISTAYDPQPYYKTAYDSALQGAGTFGSQVFDALSKGENWFQQETGLPNSPAAMFKQIGDSLDEYANSMDIVTQNPNLSTTQNVVDYASNFIGSSIAMAPLFGAAGAGWEGRRSHSRRASGRPHLDPPARPSPVPDPRRGAIPSRLTVPSRIPPLLRSS